MLGRVLGTVLLTGALGACGGKSSSSATEPAATSGGGSSSIASSTSATSSNASTTGQPAMELIDDVDHADDEAPPLPEGGSGFWWGPGPAYLGNWFVYSPPPDPITGDARAADIVPPRGESTRAYRVETSGREAGVDLFAELDHPLGRALDLSEYAGIGFWARLNGTSRELLVALSPAGFYLAAPNDVPAVELVVSNEWQLFELPFSAFGTDGHEVANIDFVVGRDGSDADFWIDDLVFLCRDQCPEGG